MGSVARYDVVLPVYGCANTVHNTAVKKLNYNTNTKENKNYRYNDRDCTTGYIKADKHGDL